MYCKHCGTEITPDARFCPKCGGITSGGTPKDPEDNVRTMHISPSQITGAGFFGTQVREQGESEKSSRTAMVMGVFFGLFGGHSFYTGHINTGIIKAVTSVFSLLFPLGFALSPALGLIQLVTLLGSLIWNVVDIVLIANGEFKDSEDQKLFHNF